MTCMGKTEADTRETITPYDPLSGTVAGIPQVLLSFLLNLTHY